MLRQPDRQIILEDGTRYTGFGFGDTADTVLEVVFNTTMAGYQEILSDPSYTGQAVVMTYPLIGNYGMADADYETLIPTIGGMIVRVYNDRPSNFRSKKNLEEVMKQYHIAGISGVDTRKLTRSIRDKGARRALITGMETTIEEGIKKIQETPLEHDQVARVSVKKRRKAESNRSADTALRVAAIDCGMKESIVGGLTERGCDVTIFPYDVTADEIRAIKPDGIFISNGPGDPEDVQTVISTIREMLGEVPMFGICLGHQILALANGAKTYKLKFGHHGGNHPVKNLATGKVEFTAQNHNYAVDADSLAGTGLEVTHLNLLDNTVEGMKCPAKKLFSVQYHPESAPGPEDSAYLFDQFTQMMEAEKHA